MKTPVERDGLDAHGNDLGGAGPLARRQPNHLPHPAGPGRRDGIFPTEVAKRMLDLIPVRTAKALGLSFPQSILLQATDAIQ